MARTFKFNLNSSDDPLSLRNCYYKKKKKITNSRKPLKKYTVFGKVLNNKMSYFRKKNYTQIKKLCLKLYLIIYILNQVNDQHCK